MTLGFRKWDVEAGAELNLLHAEFLLPLSS
jgi:hypothetical protein